MARIKSIANFFKEVFVTRTNGYIDIRQKQLFWSHFAEINKGIFTVKHTLSKDLTTLQIIIPIENGQIQIRESDTKPFKVFCTINTDKELNFSIIKKDFLDSFVDLLKGKNFSNQEKKYNFHFNDQNLKRLILKNEFFTKFLQNSNMQSIISRSSIHNNSIDLTGTFGRFVQNESELKDILQFFQCLIIQIYPNLP